MSKLLIYKNMMTQRLEITYVEYRDEEMYSLAEGEMIFVHRGSRLEPTLSLPIRTVIESEVEVDNFKALLEQKHLDKEAHIMNLNQIIEKVIK